MLYIHTYIEVFVKTYSSYCDLKVILERIVPCGVERKRSYTTFRLIEAH